MTSLFYSIHTVLHGNGKGTWKEFVTKDTLLRIFYHDQSEEKGGKDIHSLNQKDSKENQSTRSKDHQNSVGICLSSILSN